MTKPVNEADQVCPFHRCAVRKVCHKCPLYIALRGKNPQSEEIIDKWGCSFEFMPHLMLENSQMQRQTGAAVENFRNEIMVQNEQVMERVARTLPRN